jgi:hypothetical protein
MSRPSLAFIDYPVSPGAQVLSKCSDPGEPSSVNARMPYSSILNRWIMFSSHQSPAKDRSTVRRVSHAVVIDHESHPVDSGRSHGPEDGRSLRGTQVLKHLGVDSASSGVLGTWLLSIATIT